MKKIIAIVLCLAIVGVLGFGGWHHYQKYKEAEAARLAQEAYDASHVTIDGVDYEISLTELDLSGKPLNDWRGLSRIAGLKKLDVRGTQITAQTYDSIHAMLPSCEILWEVPFQGSFLSPNTTALVVSSLTEQDLQDLRYLPRLVEICGDSCTDYDVLLKVNELYPNISVSYTVELGGESYPHDAAEATLVNPDLEELERMLPYLPELRYITLSGDLPDSDAIVAARERMPQLTFDWSFTAFDREFNSMETFINLSNIPMKDTAQVESIIPLFNDLRQIDMLDCGLNNKTMDALNKRHPDTKIVWKVYICGIPTRTDAKYFMPVKNKVKELNSAVIDDLRYCSDMQVVDLGHYGVGDLSFVEYMPSLTYLLVCQTAITDMVPIGTCKNLKCLELFGTNCMDLWPLVNLTNLEDLNISDAPCVERIRTIYARYEKFPDVSPLYQMTWLHRLWMSNTQLGKAGRNAMLEALPDTEMIFFAGSATSCGWRHMPNYYTQRDIVGMTYFVN